MQPLNISLLQLDLLWEQKQANLNHISKMIDSISVRSEVIILPEMFNTGFSMNPTKFAETVDGETIQWMKDVSKKKNAILTGSLMISANEHFYNRLIWMQPNGQFGFYDKRHLFSYGQEDKHFSSGNKRLITQVKGWKICTQICYDLRFPVWNRLQKENEYDVLIFVANWPAKRQVAWNALLQARAIENQCYVIGVNRVGTDGNGLEYNGNSCIIDPLGKILSHKLNDEEIINFTLDFNQLNEVRQQFPFANDKDDFIIC